MNSTVLAPEVVEDAPAGHSRYVANNAAALGLRSARTKRFRLLDGLQAVTDMDRLTHCRVHRAFLAEWVAIVQRDGVSAYSGLQTCGSAWVCPVCSAKVRHERTLQLAHVAMKQLDSGGGLTFPTLTLAHVQRDPLAVTLNHVLEGFRYVTGHRLYRNLRQSLGIEHVCKTVEITHGYNGWHPHIHGLMFSTAPLTLEQTRDVMATLWRLWNTYAEKNRLRVLIPDRAVVVKRVDMQSERGIAALADYLFKVQDGYGIAAELVRADLKAGRSKSSRVPFDIAESAVKGNRRDLALWHEYETATHHRRVMDWTKGSAKALGMGESDEDLASLEPGQMVYDLTPFEWDLICRYRKRGEVLNVADDSGGEGVARTVERLRLRALLDQEADA
jgi:hypothetical protein